MTTTGEQVTKELFLRTKDFLKGSTVERRGLTVCTLPLPIRYSPYTRDYVLLRFPELNNAEVWYAKYGQGSETYYRRCYFKWQAAFDKASRGEPVDMDAVA